MSTSRIFNPDAVSSIDRQKCCHDLSLVLEWLAKVLFGQEKGSVHTVKIRDDISVHYPNFAF